MYLRILKIDPVVPITKSLIIQRKHVRKQIWYSFRRESTSPTTTRKVNKIETTVVHSKMAELRNYSELCKGLSPFTLSYSMDVYLTLGQIQFYANEVYGQTIIYLSPFNIAANLFSALILLTKDLRNPFNVLLSIMCMECAIPLIIRASSVYRQILTATVCTVATETYSRALHELIVYNSWGPFRAAYTWTTGKSFLTFLRYRALRSKGKWEASYTLVFSGFVLILGISAGAGVPMYMINVIGYYTIDVACGRAPVAGDNATRVPRIAWSSKMYDNDCLAQKGHHAVAARNSKKKDDSEKAARMLSVVALLTLLSEFPQGLVCIANIILPIGFQWNYADRLTVLWLAIQNIATSCNLIIYLAMSRNFRKAVLATFCFWLKRKSTSSPVSVISVTSIVSSRK